jgi:hypothetical protein
VLKHEGALQKGGTFCEPSCFTIFFVAPHSKCSSVDLRTAPVTQFKIAPGSAPLGALEQSCSGQLGDVSSLF